MAESTEYVETTVFRELLQDDLDAAERLLSGMTNSELSEFRLTATTGVDLVDAEFRARKRRLEDGGVAR